MKSGAVSVANNTAEVLKGRLLIVWPALSHKAIVQSMKLTQSLVAKAITHITNMIILYMLHSLHYAAAAAQRMNQK